MDTIGVVAKNDCCGCASCVQKCPKNAIMMIENEEGFLYPKIDEQKCVNCGLCSKVCPQLKKIKNIGNDYPKAYAMRNKNDEELRKSSSGGIFSILANQVLENGGVVFGAAYSDDLSVNHVRIENKSELDKVRGSKYVQSNINNAYREAEIELKNNREVLFTGTPCQIAGLKSYLMKEYDNLITADLVCHGVPSQKLFHTYVDYLSNRFKSKVINYNFRSKEKKGWGLVSRVETEDGRVRFIEPDFDPYYSNFLDSTIYRENCYGCHYANYNRVSDITLADYWGINGIHPDFYNEEGNSLVLINTEKGEKVISSMDDKLELVKTDLDKAASHNKNLKQPSHRNNRRNYIYKEIYEKDSTRFIKENLKIKVTTKKVLKAVVPTKVKKGIKKMRGLIKK